MKIPLVLLPGLASDERIWAHQAKHLKDLCDISVIRSEDDSPEKMVNHILQEAPPTFALAGHSMGGWLTLEIMKRAPERVTHLAILNTSARKDPLEKKESRLKMIQKAQSGNYSQLINEIVPFFIENKNVIEEVKRMFLEVGAEVFIKQEKSMLARNESLSILKKIECPTVVIHASKDKLFSLEEHQEMAAQIPNAKLAIIENSGHMSPIEMPEVVTTQLRLLLAFK